MKKKWIQSFLSILLIGMLVLGQIPLSAFAADTIASGNCGTNVTWTLDSDGKLTVSGTGAVNDYQNGWSQPWVKYTSDIISIEIGEGVTSIGSYAFVNCSNLQSISAPGVTRIGTRSFQYCRTMTSAYFPSLKVTDIGQYGFSDCSKLRLTLAASLGSSGNNSAYNANNNISLVDENGNNVTSYYSITKASSKWTIKGNLSKATASAPDCAYSGSAQTPEVTVTWQGKTLTQGTDYTVEYSDNINSGTATATITGTGNYTGTTQATFQITEGQLDVSANDNTVTYDGEEHTISVNTPADATVTYSTDGTNYSTTKPTYTNVGTYTIYYKVVKDNYKTVTGNAKLTINKKEIGISWGTTTLTYSGSAQAPSATAMGTVEGDEIVLNVDGAQTNAGENYTATVTSITGEKAGNYTLPSDVTISFNIQQSSQTAPEVSGKAESIKGKGDGTITGLTTEMEWSTEKDGIYKTVENADMTFAAGTYYVRYPENNNFCQSEATEVTIGEGPLLTIQLPDSQIGYTLDVTGSETFSYQGGTTLKYELVDGYSETQAFDITVTNADIMDNGDGTYTISNATADVVVTVFGVADVAAPNGEIKIKNNKWTEFWNNVTFGLFFKNTVDVEVTASDVGTGSGVDAVEYLLSEEKFESEDAISGTWNSLTEEDGMYKFSIQPNQKAYIYVRVKDVAGNTTVINSNGVVVYTDSIAVTSSVTFTKLSEEDEEVQIDFNGNTVKEIMCGDKLLTEDDCIVTENGINFYAEYLNKFAASETPYTFIVTYNPQGVEMGEDAYGDTPAATTISLTVKKADGSVSITSDISKTYDGVAVSEPAYDADSTGKVTFEYKLKDADDSTYTDKAPENAGTYIVRVTVAADENYKENSDTAEFTIDNAALTDVFVEQNGKLTYNTSAQTAKVKTKATAVNNQTVTFAYSATENGEYSAIVPAFTTAGEHIVYFKASALNHNDYTGNFKVYIDKQTVNEPTIQSKPFNGEKQTADAPANEIYTVEENNGGIGKGEYNVVLKLKDSDNYKWSTTEDATVTVKFIISAVANEWATAPSISSWTYGEKANTPSADARFGTVKVTYNGTANDGSTWNSENAPAKTGNYTATFTVDATDDYGSLSQAVEFTVKKAPVTVTADNASKTYGDGDPDQFTWKVTEGALVSSDSLAVNISRDSGENAETYAIKVSQNANANPNYDITFVNGTFTINKATLTVIAENKTATYGDAVPTYTVTYSGFKYNDGKSDLGGELKFTCDYAQFSDKGTYTIKASGYESDNYEFTYVDGTLEVSAKPITVTITNKNSIYGNDIAVLTATDNGIVNNDENVYKLTTAATNSSAVGKYDITGTALDGNYIITFANEDDAYEITTRELTVTVVVDNKQYDGKNTATIASAILNNVVDADKSEITLVNGTATFESVNVADGINIQLTDFMLNGNAEVLKNYTFKQPTGVTANITNGWNPVVDNEYTVSKVNNNGWLNVDLTITAKDGYELSLTNTAEGEWKETLIGAVEGADSNVTFYVRNTKNGAISEQVIENYKLDKNTETTGTTGKVSFDERNGWETFLDTISFGLFYKDEVTVNVEATDALSGVESMEYYAFESTDGTALTLEQVQAITDWTEMPKDGVGVEVQDEKQFVYYIRITDKAGNVIYLSTDGAEYDTTAPAVTGIENDETYYTTQVVTVTDKNLESITLNDEPVILDNDTLTLKGNVDAVYTIVAQDKVGNITTVVVTMKEIASIKEPIDDITEKDVKSSDEDTLQDVIDHVDELLKDEDLTEKEKKELEAIMDEAEKLIEKIENAENALNTPNTGDFNNLWMLFALLFVSGMSIMGITTYERKRRF